MSQKLIYNIYYSKNKSDKYFSLYIKNDDSKDFLVQLYKLRDILLSGDNIYKEKFIKIMKEIFLECEINFYKKKYKKLIRHFEITSLNSLELVKSYKNDCHYILYISWLIFIDIKFFKLNDKDLDYDNINNISYTNIQNLEFNINKLDNNLNNCLMKVNKDYSIIYNIINNKNKETIDMIADIHFEINQLQFKYHQLKQSIKLLDIKLDDKYNSLKYNNTIKRVSYKYNKYYVIIFIYLILVLLHNITKIIRFFI